MVCVAASVRETTSCLFALCCCQTNGAFLSRCLFVDRSLHSGLWPSFVIAESLSEAAKWVAESSLNAISSPLLSIATVFAALASVYVGLLRRTTQQSSALKMSTETAVETDKMTALATAADEARGLAMDSIAAAHSGHMGLPLGAAEIGAVLYGSQVRHRANK